MLFLHCFLFTFKMLPNNWNNCFKLATLYCPLVVTFWNIYCSTTFFIDPWRMTLLKSLGLHIDVPVAAIMEHHWSGGNCCPRNIRMLILNNHSFLLHSFFTCLVRSLPFSIFSNLSVSSSALLQCPPSACEKQLHPLFSPPHISNKESFFLSMHSYLWPWLQPVCFHYLWYL